MSVINKCININKCWKREKKESVSQLPKNPNHGILVFGMHLKTLFKLPKSFSTRNHWSQENTIYSCVGKTVMFIGKCINAVVTNKLTQMREDKIWLWRLLLLDTERHFSSGPLTSVCLHMMNTDKICSRWLSNFSPQLFHHQSGVLKKKEGFHRLLLILQSSLRLLKVKFGVCHICRLAVDSVLPPCSRARHSLALFCLFDKISRKANGQLEPFTSS